jgi:hypothetical protein
MRTQRYRGCLLACLLVAGGCLSPNNTRLPSWLSRPPAVEKKSYELHDPLPSESEGPQTQVRPRGFETPRSEARQAVEGEMLLGTPTDQPPPGPVFPGGAYPQSVPN